MWSSVIDTVFVENCIANRKQLVDVQVGGTTIPMPLGYFLVNRILVNPLLSIGMHPEPKHILVPPDDLAENGIINKKLSAGFRDAVDRNCLSSQSAMDAYCTEVLRTVHGLHKLAEMNLAAYSATISTKGIIDAMNIGTVKEARQFDLTDAWGVGINAVEQEVRAVYKRTTNALMETKIPNVLTAMLRSRSVKADQLMMSLISGSTRTDINDSVLRIALSPYINGLSTVSQFAVDTRGARKSKMYNNSVIGKMQFAVRRQALRSSVTHVVPGDCGSPGIPFTVTETIAKGTVLYGKNMVTEDGSLKEITPEMVRGLVGERITLKDGMTCRHSASGGLCHACGGRAMRLLQVGAVPSILSTSTALSPVNQLVLSTKHYFMTSTLLWSPPIELQSVFEERMHCIYIKRGLPKNLRLRVAREEFVRYTDLAYITDPTNISLDSTKYFSDLKKIGVESGDQVCAIMYPITTNQIVPVFSMEYLTWLRTRLDTVSRDTTADQLILDISDYPRDQPIMHYFTVNDSVVLLIDLVQDILERAHLKYSSIPAYLAYASNALFGKLASPGNIIHLELLLRAAMVTSPYDPRVPTVTDYNNVMFGPIRWTISRHLSTLLGYQDFKRALVNPSTFLVPKDPSPVYDPIFGK